MQMQSKVLIPWILVIILVLGLGVGGYFWYNQKNNCPKEKTTQNSDTSTSDNKDNWQRVTKADDYTFKYPKEWFLRYQDSKDNLIFINDENELKTVYNPPAETEYIPQSWVMSFVLKAKAVVDETNTEVKISSKAIFDQYIDYTYTQDHGEFSYKIDEEKDLTINGLSAKKIVGTEPEGLYAASKFVSYLVYDSTNQRILEFYKTFINYDGSLDKYSDLLSEIEKTAQSFELI